MKHFTKKLALLTLLAGLCGSAWAQVTTTLIEYGTGESTAWTATNLATWTAGGGPEITTDGYVSISGGNGGYETSKTISPTADAIINVEAVWRGRSNTGRAFEKGNGSYFRFGNIVVAQNDQDQKHGYVFTGLNNIGSVTTFTAGSYRTDITNLPFLKITMEINTAKNTLNSFSIKSEDGKTTYVNVTNVSLSNSDYTTVAFGYKKGGSVGTTNTEHLKSIKITQTTQPSVKKADYTINYIYNNQTIKTIQGNATVGSTIEAENPITTDEQKYYAADDATTSMTLVDGTNVLNVNLRKANEYAYSVKNIFGTTLGEGTYVEGEDAINVYWSKYVQNDGKWYECDESTYGVTITGAVDKTVSYSTESNIDYFFEVEELNTNRGNQVQITGNSYSGGKAQRHYGANGRTSYYYTTAIAGGVYDLSIPVTMANASPTLLSIRVCNTSGGEISDPLVEQSFSTNKTYTFNNITIPDGYALCIYSGNEFNSNAYMDYITLTKVTADVAVTADGELDGKFYATYSNAEKALDFSAVEGLTAYYVTSATTSNITIEEVEKVPAGAAVLIAGAEATTYQVPVIPNFESTETNLLQVSDGEKTGDGQTIYVLGKGKSGVGFYLKKKDSAIAAGKAYLEIEDEGTNGVKSFLSLGGDDATAISNVEAQQGTGIIYNLNGQRVAAPVKGGLYIMNGKKVLVK